MATVQERHPELFRPVSDESPRGKKRTVPMQVLCLGFNRTGTSTMTAALEKLGLPCWHSFTLLSTHFACNEMWQEAIDRKFFGVGPPFTRPDFDQLLHSFAAVSSDTPAVAFAEDLITAYPDAKVVLVEREIESWYQSYMHSIIGNMFHPVSLFVYHVDRFYVHPIGKVQLSVVEGWLGIKSKRDAERKARDRYREHYALVRRVTPKERLLEFELSQGWGPLCEFLGKEIPEDPFPHLNEQAWFDEKAALLLRMGMVKLLRRVGGLALPLLVGWGAWLWYNRSG